MADRTTIPSVDVPHALTLEAHVEPGIAMSEGHYARIQERIRKNVGDPGGSVWMALALAFLGVGVTVLVTVLSAVLTPSARGKLETVGWACLVVILICLAAHLLDRGRRKDEADDICKEMDTYCSRTNRAA